jgi:hypothetical protein
MGGHRDRHNHFQHARRRALERYDFDYTLEDEKRYMDKIRRAQVIQLLPVSNARRRVALWDEIRHIWLCILYSKSSRRIVSFYPPRNLVPFKERLETSGLGGELQYIDPSILETFRLDPTDETEFIE